jgi:hypothetical protein
VPVKCFAITHPCPHWEKLVARDETTCCPRASLLRDKLLTDPSKLTRRSQFVLVLLSSPGKHSYSFPSRTPVPASIIPSKPIAFAPASSANGFPT